MFQMVIANRLTDGVVVFYTAGGGWVENIEQGTAASEANQAESLLQEALADVDRCRVIDPYLVDVIEESGRRRPSAIREAIRARGPTVAVEAG